MIWVGERWRGWLNDMFDLISIVTTGQFLIGGKHSVSLCCESAAIDKAAAISLQEMDTSTFLIHILA